MKLTEEQFKKVKQFYSDPDWFLVKEMFMNYLEPLVDIRYLDDKDTTTSLKGEVKARKHLFNLANQFFTEADVIIGKTQEYNDSME